MAGMDSSSPSLPQSEHEGLKLRLQEGMAFDSVGGPGEHTAVVKVHEVVREWQHTVQLEKEMLGVQVVCVSQEKLVPR